MVPLISFLSNEPRVRVRTLTCEWFILITRFAKANGLVLLMSLLTIELTAAIHHVLISLVVEYLNASVRKAR